MPATVKHDRKIKLQFLPNNSASTLGGLPAIEALSQRFGLWKKLAACAALDPRKRKGRGFNPEGSARRSSTRCVRAVTA